MIDDDGTDRIESAVDSVKRAVDRVEAAVERIETAVSKVETAITHKWSTPHWVVVISICFLLWSWASEIWYSKWRYVAEYEVPSSKVYIQDEPSGCGFLTAPLGVKLCHYERTLSITRWATSQTGNPIISHDDGKTWSVFDPAGKEVPKASTVMEVHVGWEKWED
jgi:hypothetical protein